MLSFIGGPWSNLQWVVLVSILFGIHPSDRDTSVSCDAAMEICYELSDVLC
jgi:hypothetical protein